MSAEIINLRQARKRRDRVEKDAAAEANRARFGRTKSEKQLTDARNAQANKTLDQSRRDTGDRD